jgi:hypothetical protein
MWFHGTAAAHDQSGVQSVQAIMQRFATEALWIFAIRSLRPFAVKESGWQMKKD